MVTLHPKVHGGILADPDDPDHRRDLEEFGIEPISLVVVNLYPFGQEPGIELIDVGGPAMVRAAAKNHAHVGVVVDPAEYEPVLAELRAGGRLSGPTRRRLARAAFARTAAYDTEIVAWLDDSGPRPVHDEADSEEELLPDVAAAGPRAGASAALRREPAPAGGALPLRRRDRAGGTPPPSTAARR